MRTFYSIDYDKTIEKQRIVYKNTPDVIMEYVILGMTTIIVLGAPTFITIITATAKSGPNILGIILCLLWDIFIISNLVCLNSLIMINGKSRKENKTDLLTILSKSYSMQGPHVIRNNILRDIQLDDIVRWGRVITCIFIDEKVYLNVTTLYKTDSFSCFNGFLNYYSCKQIGKELEALQAAASNEQRA